MGEVGAASESRQKTEVDAKMGDWGSDPSLSWVYFSIQLPSPPAAASTRARGQLPESFIPGWGQETFRRLGRQPPNHLSAPHLRLPLRSFGSGRPVVAKTQGEGRASFVSFASFSIPALPRPGAGGLPGGYWGGVHPGLWAPYQA